MAGNNQIEVPDRLVTESIPATEVEDLEHLQLLTTTTQADQSQEIVDHQDDDIVVLMASNEALAKKCIELENQLGVAKVEV